MLIDKLYFAMGDNNDTALYYITFHAQISYFNFGQNMDHFDVICITSYTEYIIHHTHITAL